MTWTRTLENQPKPVNPTTDPRGWLIRELHKRNFPSAGERRANAVIFASGPTRTGKTTTMAKLIMGLGDRSYLPSLKYHPYYTHDKATAWRCHLSVSPVPFIQAVAHELTRMAQGLPQEFLIPGSFWHIDEPSKIKGLEYWSPVAKAVGDTVAENAFLGINVVICAQVKGRTLGILRDLSNLWVRMRTPGHGMLFRMEQRINYKSATRGEYMKPVGVCPIDDDSTKDPRFKEWMETYAPIKIYNAQEGAANRLEELSKLGYIE